MKKLILALALAASTVLHVASVAIAAPSTTKVESRILRAPHYSHTQATALTAASVELTPALFRAAGNWPVDTTANAIDIEVNAALSASDIGVVKTFVVTTGGTNAVTFTADGAGVTGVTLVQQGAGATCEDVGDWLRVTVTGAAKAHVESFCAD